MYITTDQLKPGMVLAKDIIFNNQNMSNVLLAKGEKLNSHFINKIIHHDISGVYIFNKALDNLDFQPVIDEKLEKKALTNLRDVYSSIENNEEISYESINSFSEIVNELITEISVKRELTHNIMEFRNHDEYTYQHCLNVANLSISTGIAMGLSKEMLHDLGMAGFLHDLGKVAIPAEIINKPGKLSKEEYDLMKNHPSAAVDMLKNLVSKEVLDGIESHHEKMDGSGYPHGKVKSNISLYGRILSVCDVYHALTSDRPYRKICFPNEVMEYLMGNADTQFDYDILTVFLKNVVAFPVGTFVKLSNNKIAVVIKNYTANNMRPKVRIINEDNTLGEDIDLLNDYRYMNVTITDLGYETAKVDFPNIKYA